MIHHSLEKSLVRGTTPRMPATLFLVATPIGNLEDLTLRAARLLRETPLLLCEDTRVTAKLLASVDARPSLQSVHAHTSDQALDRLLDRLEEAGSACYACDAGTPGMNDPGGRLAARAWRRGIKVVPVPGPSALTAAISACGFPMEAFVYVGFIPHKKGRQTLFRALAAEERAIIFLESTHRIEKTLAALRETLSPGRLVWVGRELTKQFETGYRGSIDAVIAGLQATSWKGEFICVLAPLSYAD